MVSASVKRNLIEKYSFYSSIQKKTLNLHLTEPVPTGWAGQKLIGICLLCRNWGRVPRRGMEHERTFLNVIFYYIKLRKLVPSEDFATKRPRGVYYTRMLASRKTCIHTLYIIPNGVGWLSCLSRWKGNAKA